MKANLYCWGRSVDTHIPGEGGGWARLKVRVVEKRQGKFSFRFPCSFTPALLKIC